jgi:hypothetical protein
MTALPDALVCAQHPHRFMHEALGRMGESAEEQAAEIALMDTGAALAETFEVLLNEFRLRPRRRYARMTPADAVGGERISPPLLLQLRAYQDAVAASKAAAPSPQVLAARFASVLEDLLQQRQRLLLLDVSPSFADREDDEAEERNRRLVRLEDMIGAVRGKLSRLPPPPRASSSSV